VSVAWSELAMEPALMPALAMRPSPELCLYSRLLALPVTALDEAIEEEVAANPALVRTDTRRCRGCGRMASFGRCSCHPGGARLDVSDREPAAPESAAAILLADAADLLGPGDRQVAEYVLADLDGRGLLDRDPASIGRDLAVDVGRVERVLASLRAAGPPGLAAPSIRECLAEQLAAIERSEGPLPAVECLLDHLEDLACGREGRVGVGLGLTVEQLREAVTVVRQRLRPFAVLGGDAAPPPPPPDLEVIAGPDEPLRAESLFDPRGGVAVDSVYRDVARGTGALGSRASVADRRHARQWLARAATFLAQLDRRQSTLEAVATRAVRHQADFVALGPAHHRPLTRAAVATDLHLHESTVSRAVKDKIVQLPDGRVLPLATMFGASTSVMEALRDLLATSEHPVSDDGLAAELTRRGHHVARRTVTKYRHALGVAPAKRASLVWAS
jgi:RNA polymerase sigma-54 factor